MFIRKLCLIVAWSLCVMAPAQAAVLTLSPATATVDVGATFAVDLQISDVGAGNALGVYDIDLAFDAGLMSLSGVTFGTGLDVLGLGSLQFDTLGVGTVNLFELSLDSAADLIALQPASFVLATVSFVANAAGTSPFSLSVNALGDANGDSLEATLEGASVTIAGGSVPEPTTLLLVAAALGTMGAVGRRRGVNRRNR